MRVQRPSLWKVVLGVAGSIALLVGLLYVVGPAAVAEALATADPRALTGVFVFAAVWMVAWSRPLYLVVRLLGVPITRVRSFLVFASIMLVNNVAPFSVVGAQPFAALLVSRYTGESYERSFAAAASVDVLNYLPAPFLAVSGLLYFAVTTSLGRTVEAVSFSLAALFVLAFVGGVAVWRRRRRIADAIPHLVVWVDSRIGPYLPGFLRSDAVGAERRVDAAVEALEQVAEDRPTLVAGLGASAVGWVLFASMLWLALYAVGAAVPVVVPLFVVPLATVMDVVPTPGGVGSEDATLVLLLVLTTGVPAATATAGVVLHRIASVLFPVAVGGASVATLRRA